MKRWSVVAVATLTLFAGCGQDVACGCGQQVTYGTTHNVAGVVGHPVAVTWSTGTGTVTLHEVRWVEYEDLPAPEFFTGPTVMLDVDYRATTGTVRVFASGWLPVDANGHALALENQFAPVPSLNWLDSTRTLAPGEGVRGWVITTSFAPQESVELWLVEVNPYERLATYPIVAPSPTDSSEQFDSRTG